MRQELEQRLRQAATDLPKPTDRGFKRALAAAHRGAATNAAHHPHRNWLRSVFRVAAPATGLAVAIGVLVLALPRGQDRPTQGGDPVSTTPEPSEAKYLDLTQVVARGQVGEWAFVLAPGVGSLRRDSVLCLAVGGPDHAGSLLCSQEADFASKGSIVTRTLAGQRTVWGMGPEGTTGIQIDAAPIPHDGRFFVAAVPKDAREVRFTTSGGTRSLPIGRNGADGSSRPTVQDDFDLLRRPRAAQDELPAQARAILHGADPTQARVVSRDGFRFVLAPDRTGLCLVALPGGFACTSAKRAANGVGFTMLCVHNHPGEVVIARAVPDGITSLRITRDGADDVTVPVLDNLAVVALPVAPRPLRIISISSATPGNDAKQSAPPPTSVDAGVPAQVVSPTGAPLKC